MILRAADSIAIPPQPVPTSGVCQVATNRGMASMQQASAAETSNTKFTGPLETYDYRSLDTLVCTRRSVFSHPRVAMLVASFALLGTTVFKTCQGHHYGTIKQQCQYSQTSQSFILLAQQCFQLHRAELISRRSLGRL
ncbi:hypothetical protein PMIN06_007190 [Paraphaeosphaeria minitans]